MLLRPDLAVYIPNMPFTLSDPELERLARELAQATGEPVEAAVAAALRERLQRARAAAGTTSDAAMAPSGMAPEFRSVEEIQAYVASLPVLDPRTPDEIVGYDDLGLPT
jgi:antitoxin VapB